MRLTNLTKSEETTIYLCLRHCQGEYYQQGVLELIDISEVERILEQKDDHLNAEKGERCPTGYPSEPHCTGKPSADDEMAKNCVVCKKPLSVNGHKYLCDVCLIQYSDKPSAMGECVWKEDSDGNYETSCDDMFVLTEGSPEDNNMKYCPMCGKTIKTTRYSLTQ